MGRHIDIDDVNAAIFGILEVPFSREYADRVAEKTALAVRNDVEESSSFKTDGRWNDDDVRLALGRVVLDSLGDVETVKRLLKKLGCAACTRDRGSSGRC